MITTKPARISGPCANCGEDRVLYDGLCVVCKEFDVDHNPEIQNIAQTTDALAVLERDPRSIVRWPFADVDAMAGPMAPGNVWYVAAFSGGGKTTFITSAIRGWMTEGYRVFVMPLELRAQEWRIGYVCQQLGIPPGDALSGRLRLAEAAGDQNARMAREQIADQLKLLDVEDESYQLYVSPFGALSLQAVEDNIRMAKRYGYHILVIDHVDHIDDGRANAAAQAVAVSQAVNKALARMAQEHDLVIVCTSQLNLDAAKTHRLAKYEPPQVQHLWFPGVKLQVATGIIGLFRPLAENVDLDLLRQAKAGEVEPQKVLAVGRMGVNAMKLRNYGGNEGKRVQLAVEWGRVEALPPQDAHGIHTGGASERPRGWK